MDTNDSQEIFALAKQCYDKGYWNDALTHIDKLSCDMTENKDVMYMRALCLARVGRTEASELLCDQLVIVYNDSRGEELKAKLGKAEREEIEKPKEKKEFRIPKFLLPAILLVIVVGSGLWYGINAIKNYVPEAIESANAPTASRTIKFGKKSSAGTLYTRQWTYDVSRPVRGNNHWKEFGEALGQVTIPLGLELKLGVSDDMPINFSGLSFLKANDLQALESSNTSVTDADLGHITSLSGLRDLDLSDTGVSEAGIAQLHWMTSLWSLSVAGITLGEQGWDVVASMSFLRDLTLDRSDVNDKRLAALCANAPLIKNFSLDENPQLTDVGIMELATLESLTNVYLSYTGITDTGLARLQGLDLERLYLEGTAITDASVAGFKNMHTLRILSFSRTQITDAALIELHSFKWLEKLDISACPFLSEKAIQSLREALPDCTVDTTGNVTRRPAMWDENV